MNINSLNSVQNFSGLNNFKSDIKTTNPNFGANKNIDSKDKSESPALKLAGTYNTSLINRNKPHDPLFILASEYLQDITEEEEKIRSRGVSTRGELVWRMEAGKPYPDCKNLYHYDRCFSFYFDEDKNIKNVFELNQDTGEMFVYDKNKQLIKQYTKEDREALHYYKYHPDSIHSKLRDNINIWSGNFMEETLEMIDRLDKIFSNDDKTFRTEENQVVYRALQQNLSPEQIQELTTIGGIYTDKSYSSTTTDLDTAKRFSCGNPILKINLPKDTKYMDIERLFNIDREHWREQEILLDKNSSFAVTSFDSENNIIEVDYIQNKQV